MIFLLIPALLYGNLTEESEAILSDEEIEVNSIDGDLSWDSFETSMCYLYRRFKLL